jgi:hypothetical protein
MTVKEIRIVDTGKGAKSVADDLDAVLGKIESWDQGSVGGFYPRRIPEIPALYLASRRTPRRSVPPVASGAA